MLITIGRVDEISAVFEEVIHHLEGSFFGAFTEDIFP